jgi:serine/threonine protein kinase
METSPVETIFFESLQRSDPAEREEFLREACAGNAALRQEVDRLLAAHTNADTFLQKLGSKLNPQEWCPEAQTYTDASEGTFIGPYRLGECLGEGGGGIVYLAGQETPVRRQVALKVIKLGMDTKRVIARFEAERQTLAMMEHPNIARVFDAGATETGRPFFVMELVRGVRITDYCVQNEVPLRERLAMFQQVCHAIQHAHQKGVIHRDIKPSNILVNLQDGVPVPKIIDFGIAKATAEQRGEGTAFTVNEQLLGTPAYMSPEQVQGSIDVDTRTDIYSLGVVLYELLAGRPPFDNKELLRLGVDEMRRTLCEVEPPRPSAMAQGAEASTLRGDLDWIVMKALEKNRERRYQTVRGFALDIEHYLHDEPVQARPPSRVYRLQKLVRRNKGVFAALGATTLVLVTGLTVSTWLFVRASNAERQQTQLRLMAEEREKVARAAILLSQKKMAEADALLGDKNFQLSQPSLEATQVFRDLAIWNATQRRDWRKAATRLLALVQVNRFAENDQTDNATRDLLMVAPTLVEIGDLADYEKIRQLAIARFARSKNPVAAEQIIKISLIQPAGPDMLLALEPLAHVAEASLNRAATPYGLVTWRAMALALMAYRQGRFNEALHWCHRASDLDPGFLSRRAVGDVIQAMAEWQLGQKAAARADLENARKLVEEGFQRPLKFSADQDGYWFDWLNARILLREATALMQQPEPAQSHGS